MAFLDRRLFERPPVRRARLPYRAILALAAVPLSLALAANAGAIYGRVAEAGERAHRLSELPIQARASLAAASSASFIESAASALYRALCPYLTDCEETAEAPPVPPAPRPPAAARVAVRATTTPAVREQAPTPARAIVQQITNPVIERIVERVVPAAPQSTISQTLLDTRLAAFESSLSSRMLALAASGNAQTAAVYNVVGQMGRIDQLSGTSLSSISVNGVSGLTDADIPDTITASGYLPLTGGTLTGAVSGTDLTLSGTLTAGALSVSALSSSGALTGPYITATSTAATSTLAGGFSVSGYSSLATTTITGALTVNGNTNITEGGQLTVGDKIIAPGEIGLGTSTPAAKLAIQSTNPAQTSLLIVGTTTQSSPLLDIFSGANANLFRITSAGNVGIGTTSPSTILNVYGNPGTGKLATFDRSGDEADVSIFSGYGSHAGLVSTEALVFHTNTSGIPDTSPDMFISTTGNVGIGTTSPAARLHVMNGTLMIDNDSTSDAQMWFRTWTQQDWSLGIDRSDSSKFKLSQATTLGTSDRLTVDTNGNVGIGTTSPAAKLEVSSSGSGVASKLYIDGDRGLQNVQASNIGFRNKSTNIASIV